MGLDVLIYCKTKTGQAPDLEDSLPKGYAIIPAKDYAPEGATHEVDQMGRFYGVYYERGPWVKICAALMLLHACEDVEIVWYGSDCGGVSVCTPDDVLELSKHFMLNGNRPYRSR